MDGASPMYVEISTFESLPIVVVVLLWTLYTKAVGE